METVDTLAVGSLVMGLVGGLAIFLYGMEKMTGTLKMVAGDRMKAGLARLTTNRFKATLAGAFVTAVIQSSSVTTVLVVGFISAGLITLGQSIGIIMGANIGTTVTAQLLAFKVTDYALAMIAVGFGMAFLPKRDDVRRYGSLAMSLGLIFFGMEVMSDATRPLRTYRPFIEWMQHMGDPISGILVGTAFTALIQSSAATTGVVIVLAGQGLITLEAGIALAFGANIGTCVTALIAAVGKPREAVRGAAVHVIFNLVGVVLWFGFIAHLAGIVRWLSPTAPGLTGVARLAAETPRQIANAHTLFNMANTLIFLLFTGAMARLVTRLVPEAARQEPGRDQTRYLDEVLLQTPAFALDVVRLELGRLGAGALGMLRGSLEPVLHGPRAGLEALEDMDNDLDRLHDALVTYLGRLSLAHLTSEQSRQLSDDLSAANYLEGIGDVVETNLTETGRARLEHDHHVSSETEMKLTELHQKVCWAVEGAVRSLVERDRTLAEEVQAARSEVNRLAESAAHHLADRLVAEEPNRLIAFKLESELIEYLNRVYYFARRTAELVIFEPDGRPRSQPQIRAGWPPAPITD